MAPPIDREPLPRLDGKAEGPCWPQGDVVHRFEPPSPAPSCDFFRVLDDRRSRSGSDLKLETLGMILWHAMRLRERRADGRFGEWESRSAPSAGGIHGMRFVVLPLGGAAPAGLYDPDGHTIQHIADTACAAQAASDLLGHMGLPRRGWFVQVIVDMRAYESRYEKPNSLILRDVGGLCCTTTLVAEAYGAFSRVLGHLDAGIAAAFKLAPRYAGAGGLHLSAE